MTLGLKMYLSGRAWALAFGRPWVQFPRTGKKKMQPLFGNRFFADVIKVKMEMKSW
jgi:hypothetical protein